MRIRKYITPAFLCICGVLTIGTSVAAAKSLADRPTNIFYEGNELTLCDEDGNVLEGRWYNGELYLPATGVANAIGINQMVIDDCVIWSEGDHVTSTSYTGDEVNILSIRATDSGKANIKTIRSSDDIWYQTYLLGGIVDEMEFILANNTSPDDDEESIVPSVVSFIDVTDGTWRVLGSVLLGRGHAWEAIKLTTAGVEELRVQADLSMSNIGVDYSYLEYEDGYLTDGSDIPGHLKDLARYIEGGAQR